MSYLSKKCQKLTFLGFKIGTVTATYGPTLHFRGVYNRTQNHNLFSSSEDSEGSSLLVRVSIHAFFSGT